PSNEPVLAYAPGSPEKAELKAALSRMSSTPVEIPLFIGGREERNGALADVTAPHAHALKLGRFHQAGAKEAQAAIEGALAARAAWSAPPFEERAAIFLRAAELLSGKYRSILNAATMLGQSKTAHQAEIDAACETIDFWRWNVHFARRIYAEQPYSPPG